MAYIVFFLAALLGFGGGYSLFYGFDDLTTERGLALTLSGTVALSIGIVTFAIGFGLLHLSKIARLLTELKSIANGAQYGIEQERSIDRNILNSMEDEMLQSMHIPSRPPAVAATESARENGYLNTGLPRASTLAGAGVIAAAAAATASVMAGPSKEEREKEAASPEPLQAEAAVEPLRERASSSFAESHADISRLIDELSSEEPELQASPETVNPDFGLPHADTHVHGDAETVSHSTFEAEILRELSEAPTREIDEVAPETPIPTQEHAIESHHDNEKEEVTAQPHSAEPADVIALPDHATEHFDNEDRHEDGHGHHFDAEPAEPVEVIGSYESAGVTYTLYADGSVVAQEGSMRESYPSLEALKLAFERGESIFSV